MKMTKEEYNGLIAHFTFLEDKVEACYKRENRESTGEHKKRICTVYREVLTAFLLQAIIALTSANYH